MNDIETEFLIFTVNSILDQPLETDTKNKFIMYKNKLDSGSFTSKDLKGLNNLIKLKNKETLAAEGLLYLVDDTEEAANLLLNLQKRKLSETDFYDINKKYKTDK
jgi:hypothetical protein